VNLVATRPANGRHTPPKPKPDNVARLMPHSTEAEESLLGAMLLSPRAIAAATEAGIEAGHYYAPTRGHIHHAIVTVHARGNGVDAITVAAELDAAGLLEQCGGTRALTELQAGTLGPGAAANHAALIVKTAEQRRFLGLLDEANAAARDGEDPAVILARLTGAAPAAQTTKPLPVTPVHELLANPPPEPDPLIDGLLRVGELMVIAAEANVGKSWWCMQMALSLAEGFGSFVGFRVRKACKVLYVHQEMDAWGASERWRLLLGNDTMPPRICDAYDPVVLGVMEEMITEGNRRTRMIVSHGHEALEARIAADRPDAVIIDTWGAVYDGPENDKQITNAVVRELHRMAKTYQTAIVVVHHFKKPGIGAAVDPFQEFRGSGRLNDSANTRVAITSYFTPEKAKRSNVPGVNDAEIARRYANLTVRRRSGRQPPKVSMRFDPDECRWHRWDERDEQQGDESLSRVEAAVRAREAKAAENQQIELTRVINAAWANGGGFVSIREACALLGESQWSGEKMLALAIATGVLEEIAGPNRSRAFKLKDRPQDD